MVGNWFPKLGGKKKQFLINSKSPRINIDKRKTITFEEGAADQVSENQFTR